MREKLSKFMMGRSGSDQLNRFISVLTCVLLLISMFFGPHIAPAFWTLGFAGLILCYWRAFSKNVGKRREENAKYLSIKEEFFAYFRGARERQSQRKDYVFFRCPACRTMLRVPRGKGKIKVVCRKCGNSFIKRS